MRSGVIQKERTEGNLATPAIAEVSRLCFCLFGGVISFALLWFVFSWLVVPGIIESAYRGESLPFLNSIISGQGIHPVESYLAAWEAITWRVLGMLILIGLIPLPLVLTGPEVQRYLERRYGQAVTLKPITTNTILALTGLALVFYLYFLQPVGFVYFVTEDYWAEYGSFVAWLMAFSFLTWTIIKERAHRRLGFVLLALGSFFVAMEEINWGQRILELRSPTLLRESNMQQEINLHNLITIHPQAYLVPGIVVLLWAILLPTLATKSPKLRGWCEKLGIPIISVHLWPLFIATLVVLIYPLVRRDEVGELFLGITLAVLSLDIVVAQNQETRSRGRPATASTLGMVLWLVILTLFLVGFLNHSQERLKDQLNWFASKGLPSAGLSQQAEMIFEYMDRHPEFVKLETHWQYGLLLMERGQQSKAREILEAALVDQERYAQRVPWSSLPHRIAGQVLGLLGRQQEAETAFANAIDNDRARLDDITDPRGKAMIHFSLGKTLLARGDREAASEQLSIARGLVPDRRTQIWMERWIEEKLK